MLITSPELTALFHPNVLALLDKRGIEKLYPPQWEAVQAGITGKNLIISIPTASGKTLIAEILAFQTLCSSLGRKKGKILYLCPLKALAQEKYSEFQQVWEQFGFKVGISTSDIDRSNGRIFKNDLIILTNEKADSILRLNPSLHQQISIVICDEIHLINDPSRGTTLEFLLTRIRVNNPEVQIIGLSATIKNAHDLAGWLEGKLITSTWRPVPLKEGYYLNDEINFKDGSVRRLPLIPNLDEISTLTIDIKKEKGQALIFTNSRRSAMAGAEKLAQNLGIIATKEEKVRFSDVSAEFVEHCDDQTKISERLSKVLAKGVAFHHAGLTSDQLKFIVEKFSARQINAIVCTPTLAAGVNTPARRVIIKTLYRYSADSGIQKIPIIEYKQMAGRAGRPRYDPYGEVIILGSQPEKLKENALEFILGEPEAISSKLSNTTALNTHILSLIVSKVALSSDKIQHFLEYTFHYYMVSKYGLPDPDDQTQKHHINPETKAIILQHEKRSHMRRRGGRGGDPYGLYDDVESVFTTATEVWEKKHQKEAATSISSQKEDTASNKVKIQEYFDNAVSHILKYFQDKSIVESCQALASKTTRLIPTEFGVIITKSYIPPGDAVLLLDQLHLAYVLHKNSQIILNSVSWLHVLTRLHSFRKFYLRKQDYPGIIAFRDDHCENFIMEKVWSPHHPEFTELGQEIKVTKILFDWINERPDRDIVEQYNIGSGDLHRTIDNALRILRILRQIAGLDETFPWLVSLKNLYYRLQHGILPNLIPLVKIRGIGRVRARKLYRSGFTSLSLLKSASVDDLAQVPLIGDALASQIKSHLHLSKAERSIEKREGSESSKRSKNLSRKKKKKKGLDAFLNT